MSQNFSEKSVKLPLTRKKIKNKFNNETVLHQDIEIIN